MAQIIVDENSCTRCGICVKICPSGIIGPVDEDHLPQVQDEYASHCMYCGHCEAFCPSRALTLNFRPEEKVSLPVDAGIISAEDIGF